MLFPFAIGVHSALSKGQNRGPNYLIQEGAIRKLFGINEPATAAIARIVAAGKKTKPGLSASELGKAAHKNPETMKQMFRLYGANSKVVKKATPSMFGKLSNA